MHLMVFEYNFVMLRLYDMKLIANFLKGRTFTDIWNKFWKRKFANFV